jgi:hypothetical protein
LFAAAKALLAKIGVIGEDSNRSYGLPWRVVVLVILGAWLVLGEHLTSLKIVGNSIVDSWRCDPGVCLKDKGREKPSFDDALRVIMELVL